MELSALIHFAAIGTSAIILVLSVFLLLEVIASFFTPASGSEDESKRGKISVIVPAHNEAEIIGDTLKNIKDQLLESDELIVVADNCTDDTALIAERCGASCLIRNDQEHIGKGYALQFAIDALRKNPPEIVLFADADCLFEETAIARIAEAAKVENRPVQALYLMLPSDGMASTRQNVAAFAWLFINQVRMRGLQKLFDVTRITGSGFAMPWHVVADVDMASSEIVEDLALTFELSKRGRPPKLLDAALVTSHFPDAQRAQFVQSARWSVGSLNFGLRHAPGFLIDGVLRANLALVGASLDLMIPPITVLFSALFGGVVFAAFSLLLGSAVAMYLMLLSIGAVAGALSLGWAFYGRKYLPPSEMLEAVKILAMRAKVFGRRGRGTATKWTATRSNKTHD